MTWPILIHGQEIGQGHSLIPVSLFPDFGDQVQNGKSMIDILANKYAYLPSKGNCQLAVRAATHTEALALDISRRSPVLCATSRLTSRSGHVCEWIELIWRPDSVMLGLEAGGPDLALIYLDHSATTWPSEKTIADYARDLHQVAANPASLHRLGQQAARLVQDSKASLARSLGCQTSEVILTSGGSESINMGLKGTVAANPKRGRTIVTLAGEHAATRETLSYLHRQGYIIRTVAIQSNGQVDLGQLEAAIDEDTVMLTLLLVNNETGVVQPLDEIVSIRNRKRPRAAIHSMASSM